MTKEEAKEFYPILQSYAEGKAIECRTKPSAIEGTDVPNDWTEIKEIEFWSNTEYRIKPEETFRPFGSAQECIEEMRKHEPFGWVKYKSNLNSFCSPITDICCDSVAAFIKFRENWLLPSVVFERYTFLDGSPFGVKVEDKEK